MGGVEVRLEIVEKTVDSHQNLLIVGTGDAPLKEIGRAIGRWLEENKDLPALVRSHEKRFEKNAGIVEDVGRQGRWIENVNKIGWIIASSAIGMFLVLLAGLIVFYIRATAITP